MNKKKKEEIEILNKPLSEEDQERAKHAKELLEKIMKDPDFKYANSSFDCFVHTSTSFLLMIATILAVGLFKPETILYAILVSSLLFLYDCFGPQIEDPYRRLFLNSNHALHLLVWGILILLIKAKYPEVILGLDLLTLMKILVWTPFFYIVSSNFFYRLRIEKDRKILAEMKSMNGMDEGINDEK